MSAANQNSGSDLFRFKRVPKRDLCVCVFFFGLVESRNWGWWIAGSVDGAHCSTIAAGDPKKIVTYLSILGEIDPSN